MVYLADVFRTAMAAAATMTGRGTVTVEIFGPTARRRRRRMGFKSEETRRGECPSLQGVGMGGAGARTYVAA